MNFIRKNSLAIIFIVIAILFIVIGIFRGEIETVFRKAVNICMECIGIG